MARLVDVRDDLADSVAAAVPESVTHARTPDAIVTPAVVVTPASPFAQYRRAMGDSTSALLRFDVVVLTGRVAELAAQELLDVWASPDGPVVSALLDGSIVDAEVVSVVGSQYGSFRFGATDYLGFSLLVEVEA